ncbi:MAG: hypothetical protein RLZZ127_123 [Planctomycetota bacterium]|jgi:hypothetical protein
MDSSGIPLAAGIAVQAKAMQMDQAVALALVAATAQVQAGMLAAGGDSAAFSPEALAALAAEQQQAAMAALAGA